MFLIHSELYFAYILFGLTKYKKVCFLNFGFNLRYFLGVIKYLYDYFSKKSDSPQTHLIFLVY